MLHQTLNPQIHQNTKVLIIYQKIGCNYRIPPHDIDIKCKSAIDVLRCVEINKVTEMMIHINGSVKFDYNSWSIEDNITMFIVDLKCVIWFKMFQFSSPKNKRYYIQTQSVNLTNSEDNSCDQIELWVIVNQVDHNDHQLHRDELHRHDIWQIEICIYANIIPCWISSMQTFKVKENIRCTT